MRCQAAWIRRHLVSLCPMRHLQFQVQLLVFITFVMTGPHETHMNLSVYARCRRYWWGRLQTCIRPVSGRPPWPRWVIRASSPHHSDGFNSSQCLNQVFWMPVRPVRHLSSSGNRRSAFYLQLIVTTQKPKLMSLLISSGSRFIRFLPYHQRPDNTHCLSGQRHSGLLGAASSD